MSNFTIIGITLIELEAPFSFATLLKCAGVRDIPSLFLLVKATAINFSGEATEINVAVESDVLMSISMAVPVLYFGRIIIYYLSESSRDGGLFHDSQLF